MDQSSDALIFADRHGTVRVWNRGAEAIFGYSAAEILGNGLDVIIPERLRRAHWEGFRRAIDTGQTKHGGRVLEPRDRFTRTGVRLYVDLSFGLVKDRSGAVAGAFAIGRDCTARYTFGERSQGAYLGVGGKTGNVTQDRSKALHFSINVQESPSHPCLRRCRSRSSPHPEPFCSSCFASVATIRVPVAAKGWPSATLPPFQIELGAVDGPKWCSAPKRGAAVFLGVPSFERAKDLRSKRLMDFIEVKVLPA